MSGIEAVRQVLSDWKTFQDMIAELPGVSKRKIRGRTDYLRKRGELFCVARPWGSGFLWHIRNKPQVKRTRSPTVSVGRPRWSHAVLPITYVKDYELPNELGIQLGNKIDQMFKSHSTPASRAAKRRRAASVAVNARLSALEVLSLNSRIDDGFPPPCRWYAASLATQLSPTFPPPLIPPGAHHYDLYSTKIFFYEQLVALHFQYPQFHFNREYVGVSRLLDRTVAVSAEVGSVLVNVATGELYNFPRRDELIDITKNILLGSDLLKHTFTCFSQPPEFSLLNQPRTGLKVQPSVQLLLDCPRVCTV
jgi:hypothetical protein